LTEIASQLEYGMTQLSCAIEIAGPSNLQWQSNDSRHLTIEQLNVVSTFLTTNQLITLS